jgi:hypothetical protein
MVKNHQNHLNQKLIHCQKEMFIRTVACDENANAQAAGCLGI